MKIGYHYTSLKEFKSIKKNGLIPYDINIDGENIKGVWIWKNRCNGKSHLGNIIRQMAFKGCDDVVMIKLQYDEKETYHPEGFEKLILSHCGTLENYIYHKREKSTISNIKIFPFDIIDYEVYNLNKILEQYGRTRKSI